MIRSWVVLLLALAVTGVPALGQPTDQRLQGALEKSGLDEQLGETVPDDIRFVDETGARVRIGDYLDGETPVLLNLVYHNCPMLCNLVLDGLSASLRQMNWVPGQQFEIVTVSFAADETPDLAARQKQHYVDVVGKPAAADGWHFLTGETQDIQRLADAVGFQFHWVAQQQTYAHPAALIFLSGDGTITRYLYGLDYPPRDVRNALVEASNGTVGTVMDQVVLYCFQFDPNENAYVLQAFNVMKLGGVLTVLVLGAALAVFWRRERRRQDEVAA